ncbi:MAG: helix-turn-helix transcriptional regulator [Chloroflexota bacterium]|nr:helix-turn-helix transcriptional regulator [Chloroflexota bacterium]
MLELAELGEGVIELAGEVGLVADHLVELVGGEEDALAAELLGALADAAGGGTHGRGGALGEGGLEGPDRREAILELLNLLTPRQREVAALIAGGYTNEQIARKLTLTPGTVANHVEHILRRLSFRSRSEVAALAGELGLHRQRLSGDERAG